MRPLLPVLEKWALPACLRFRDSLSADWQLRSVRTSIAIHPPKAPGPSLKSLTDVVAGALRPDDSVQTAGIRMGDHDTSKWPVSQDRKLVGMINKKIPNGKWLAAATIQRAGRWGKS